MTSIHTNASRSENDYVFIQANLWEGRCYYPIAKFLYREQPHIFSVQELLTGPALAIPSYMTQEALLQKNFFEQVSEGKSVFSQTRTACSFDQRCATFTRNRAKIIATHHIELFKKFDHRSEEEIRYDNYRGLLHTMIELNDGQKIHVLNHHGHLVIDGRIDNPIAEMNFRKIADYINTLSDPVIFSGDFNIYKEAPALQPLKQIGLRNLNEVYGVEAGRNELSWKPEECVCHVFVSDHIIVKDYYVATDMVSDHQPLVLHFNLHNRD